MNRFTCAGVTGIVLCGLLAAASAPTNTSTVAITISGAPVVSSQLGQRVTLAATVTLQSSGNPVTSGSVTFFDGAIPLGAGILNGSGKAVFATSLLPSGSNSLTAFYVGESGAFSPGKSSTISPLTVISQPQIGFSPANTSKTGIGLNPAAVAVGDFNGDGNADLAISNESSRSVSVLLGNGSGVFTAATGSPYTVGGLAFALALGDFNGDGSTDIAVTTLGSTTPVSILLNNGSGTFSVTNITATDNSPESIAVGDFNGDGIADLAYANETDGTVIVLLGNGSGGFTAATNSPFTVGSQPTAIVVADFNGDGKADIATANSGSDTITILLGDGTGKFTAGAGSPIAVNAGPESPYTLAVADLNGDGFPDLVTGNPLQETVSVFLNTSGNPGHFTQATGSPYNLGMDISEVIVGDFNGDGKLDIASLNGSEFGVVSVLPGDGSGHFGTQQNYPISLPEEGLSAFAVADFNGDGVSDIVTANDGGNNSMSILLGVSSATTTTLSAGPNPSTYGQSVQLTATVSPLATAGDTVTFLSDGASLGTGQITVSFGVATATLSTSALTGGTHALTAIYDGGPVWAASSTLTPTSQIVNPATSTTTLTSAPNPSVVGQGVLLTATATTGATGTVSFYNNAALLATRPLSGGNPDTAAYTVSNLRASTSPNSITAIYSGDINYLTSTSNAVVQTVTASLTSTSAVTVTVSGSPATSSRLGQTVRLIATVVQQSNSAAVTSGSVTFFDGANLLGVGGLNGSGAATLSTALLPSGSNSLTAFYQGVSGAFAPSKSLTVSTLTVNGNKQTGFAAANTSTTGVGNNPAAVAVGDFNGDGIVDLAIANQLGHSVSVLLGNNLGGFTAATGSPYGVPGDPYAVVAGDFNGDGLTDIAVSGYDGGGNIGILLNSVSRTFTVTTVVNDSSSPESLAVGDFNGDGIADLAFANEVGGTVGILLGNGSGGFTAATGSPFGVGANPKGIAVADFNGDGKADIATANSGDANVSILLGNGSGQFTQATGSPYPANSPSSIAVADFNGDGYPDFAVADYVQGAVSVFLNSPTTPGQFTPASGNPYTAGTTPSGVIVGDFNGDGKLDIAALNSADGTVSVLPGDGMGNFSALNVYPIGAPAVLPTAFAVADFNSDGISDIAATGFESNTLSILLGTGSATITTLSAAPNPSTYGQSVQLTATVSPLATAGDTVAFFADTVSLATGPITIAGGVATATLSTSSLTSGVHALTATYNGGSVYTGSSTLTPTPQTVNQAPSTTTLTSAPNPSGSGQGVLLTATVTVGATGTVSFYNNAGPLLATRPLSGGSPNTATYTVSNLLSSPSPNSITAVYNGDQNYLTSTSNAVNQTVTNPTVTSLSLSSGANPSTAGLPLTFKATVVPSSAGGTITFMDGSTQIGVVNLSGGTASLTPSPLLVAGSHSLTAVYGGDSNDGGSTSAALIQIVRTNTITTLSVPSGPTFGQVVTLQASVLPRPATAPFGSVTYYDGATVLGTAPLPASGSASFSTALLSQGPRTIRARYDGTAAFAPSLSAVASPQVIVASSPQGGLKPEVTYPASPATIPNASGVVEGDFNGDGHWDLAVITSSPGPVVGVEILLGNGDGTFQAPHYYATLPGSGAPNAIAVADFNGDGAQDLAVATSTSIEILLNNGNGTFGSPIPSSPGATVTLSSIAVADFNGDGYPDLLVGGFSGAGTLLGNGDGTFQAAVPVAATLSHQVYVATADFNSDGMADFAVADNQGDLYIFPGNGDGTFGTPGSYPVTGNPLSIAVGDINHDGNPDVILGTSGSSLRVLLGNSAGGLGTPASPGLNSPGAIAAFVAIGDFNGDGLLDVAVADDANAAIYIFPGNGDGTFQAPLSHNTPAGIANAIVAGNFAADGFGDLVITDGVEAGVLLGSTQPSINCGAIGGSFVVGIPYSLSCSAAGGVTPYTFSITSGLLPPGSPALSLNSSTGAIAGTPNTIGKSIFTVQVADSSDPPQVVVGSNLTINVVASLTPTTTSLNLSAGANPSTSGQSLTFQAAVLPSTATGSVTFFDGVSQLGSSNLSSGIATFTTSGLSVGLHSIGATYNGDANDASSMAAVLPQTVNQVVAPPAPAPSGPSPVPQQPVSISTTSLPFGQVGQSYSASLAAISGSGNYTWSSGALPPGLALSSSGTISGTPTALFNGPVSFTVNDISTGFSASTPLTLTIYAPITISGNTSLGDVAVGASVAASYTVSGGLPPYKPALSGAPGLSVDSSGNIRGSASQPGNFSPMLTVTDSASFTSSLTLSLAVLGISGSLPAGATTSSYSGNVSGVGGVPPYSYAASGVPPGLTFSGGTLSGQPKNAGPNTVGVQVTDSKGVSASEDFSFTITGAAPATLTIVTTSLPDGFVGQPYAQTLDAAGGAPGYTWSRSGGQMPAGLSLTSGGAISGTPAAPGPWTIGVEASDTSGAQVLGTVTIDIQPAPLQITNGATFPTGLVGVDYPVQVLAATGGIPPYTFSIKGSLPDGLALTNGQIGGTPGAAGSFGFTLVATDSAVMPATATLAVTILIQANAPDLILSSATASFSLAPGMSAAPLPNAITEASSLVSQILTFTTSSSVPWLTVDGSSNTPGSISVGPNSTALALSPADSPYSGTVTVTCTALVCSGKSQTIAVSLTVAAPPPQLSPGSSLLSFTALTSNPQPSSSALGIVNSGGGSLAIQSVTAADSWISVGAFPAAVAPGPGGSVMITASPAGLNPGYYLSSVTVASSAGSASVPVTLFVAGSGTMTLGPAGTQFSMPQGGVPGNSSGSFLVGVSSGSVSFTASVLPGASWLSGGGSGVASPASPGTVGFLIDPAAVAALPAGVYYGTIRVSAAGATTPGAIDSPQDFQVILSISPAGSDVVPDPEPAGLLFIGSGATLPAQTIQLFASSRNIIGFQASSTVTDGAGWLSVTPRTGFTSASSPAQISVTANPAGLSPGVYRAGVSFAFASAVRTVNVTLIIPATTTSSTTSTIGSNGSPAGRNSPAAAGLSCAGAQIAPAQTGLVSNFAVPASQPVPLAVTLVDTCGNAVGNAQVVANFSNGDPPLSLPAIDTATGLYSGTWTPRTASSQVTILAIAAAPGYNTATTRIPGQVVSVIAPVLAPNGTLDVFNPQVGAGLAPGNIVQIYGSGLASQATSAGVLPLPTEVNGTSVIIGGLNAPLYYVSPGQINAQIPFELSAGNQYQVIVNVNGALTTPQPIQLTEALPGILQFNSGEVVAQHRDGTLIQDSSPAVPGEYVTIYLSGMGITSAAIPSGTPSPASPLANVVDTPVLTLNGIQAPVLFGGLTPGLVGLYQIDFQVPLPLADGYYELQIKQGGAVSNKTIIPVKN